MIRIIPDLKRNLGRGIVLSTHTRGNTVVQIASTLSFFKMQIKTIVSFLFGLSKEQTKNAGA